MGRTEVREIETKFEVPGLFVVPDLTDPDVGIEAAVASSPVTLRATYYDSASLQLAREGITLRHRTGEGAARWTLKIPTPRAAGSGLDRSEISLAGPGGAPPAELCRLVTAHLRGAPLVPVAVMATRRVTVALLDAERAPVGELVDDTVSLLDGRRVLTRFREIEVEQAPQAPGGEAACRSVGERLRRAGASAGTQVPKLVRALGPPANGPSEVPAPPRVSPKSPAGDLVAWSLRSGLRRLIAADVAVRRDEDDAVHQLRVACRRLRSDLRTFRPLLDDARVDELRTELSWLAGSLGEARDLEVLRGGVQRLASSDPLAPLEPAALTEITRLLAEREQVALRQAHDALASPRHVALLQQLVEVSAAPQLTALASQRCAQVLPDLVGVAWRHLAKRAGRLEQEGPDADWHRARIHAKRVRYAAEVAQVALGKPARATARRATAIQEVLGAHQDAAVAADRLLALGAVSTAGSALAVTCGRLAERERFALRAARRSFPSVWRSATSGSHVRWLQG